MAGFDNDIAFAKNADFTQADNQNVQESNGLITNGQLWIGTTAANAGGTHINVGALTSPDSSLTIGYVSPNITLQVAGSVVTSVLGQSALVAPAVTVTTVGSVATVEDRTWQTQYVVDPSTTQGLRGTFTTIQAAIDQANTDGAATSGRFATISLRNVAFNTFVENLVFPASVRFNIVSNVPAATKTPFPGAYISGVATLGAGAQVTFQNVGLDNSTASVFSLGSGSTAFLVNSIATQLGISTGTVTANNSIIQDISSTGGTIQCFDCEFDSSTSLILTDTTFRFEGCFGDTEAFVLNGTSAGTISNCRNFSFTGTTNGQITLVNTSLSGVANLPSATIFYDNLSTSIAGTALLIAANHLFTASSQGNVIDSKTVSASASIAQTDYYTGVTSTAAPVTITLPVTNVKIGQSFIVKDESGAAGGANPINIVVSGGALIDGVATQLINTNYGSMTFIFNGTNYFII